MNHVDKLRGVFCYKILPLVYDDSLSYYEVLCKVTAKLNELVEYFNDGLEDAITEVISDYVDSLTLTSNEEIASYDADTETLTITDNLEYTFTTESED